MPSYECRLFDSAHNTLRSEILHASDDPEAHRAVMTRMMRVGSFSGYELWCEGRKVDAYSSALDDDDRPHGQCVPAGSGAR